MKIGVSTLAMYPEELENILDRLEELKVDFCEIINEYPYHQVGIDELESYQIQTTIHAPLSDINLASHNQAIRKASVQQMKRSIDLARDLDAEVVVVHPGQMPILRRDLEEAILGYNLKSLRSAQTTPKIVGLACAWKTCPASKVFSFRIWRT